MPKLPFFLKFLRANLETKIVVLLIILSILPLLGANILWFSNFQRQLLESNRVNLLSHTHDITKQVEGTIQTKEISLIIHSQTNAALHSDLVNMTSELQAFLFQDEDILNLSILDSTGKEVIKIDRNKVYSREELIDQSTSPIFRVPTYVGGEEYISPVMITPTGKPYIQMAVPIVKPEGSQNLQNLRTSFSGKARKIGDISGVVVATIDLSSLWKEITSANISNNGYVYLVDDKGKLLAYPNALAFKTGQGFQHIPEVEKFLSSIGKENTEVHQVNNEFSEQVFATHLTVKPVNWGVITQVPVANVYQDIYRAGTFAVVLFLIILCIIIISSLWVSTQIVGPITLLQQGANIIGSGNFEHRLMIKTGDEIENLAKSFNQMAENLSTSLFEIAAERNKLSVILSGITDAVIALDLENKIVTFNKAAEELTGYSSPQVLGRHIGEIINIYNNKDKVSYVTYCHLQPSGYEGITYNQKNLKLLSASKNATVNLIAGQIAEGPTINLGSILTFHDLSKEQQLEDMKLDFVSMAAHELRTPLTSIKGYLYVFMRDNKDRLDEKQTTVLSRVNVATQRIVSLVENLLNISRIERGALKVSLEAAEWLPNVKEVISELEDQAKDKKHTLTLVDPVTPLPKVYIDPFRINEVLTNLIANAINYTEPGGQIKVWLEVKDNEVITHVTDNGEGIPAEALPHLFTKFYRVSGKLEQGSKGTGLGLYITKSIVEMHHGKIWVDSKLGAGSTFSFSLPTTPPPTTTKA